MGHQLDIRCLEKSGGFVCRVYRRDGAGYPAVVVLVAAPVDFRALSVGRRWCTSEQ